MSDSSRVRRSAPEDLPFLRAMLFEAAFWRPGEPRPPQDEGLARPDLAKLLRGFGKRTGDLGVVAERDGRPAGAAWCRLWTPAEHSYGFVDAQTPELAIGVLPELRGQGIGLQLLRALAVVASEDGHPRLSLSVEHANPARRLYERAGYREHARDDGDATLVLDLLDPALWRSLPRGRPARTVVPSAGQESVWDYPRPPLLEPARRPVRVEHAGQVVAESARALRVCETASPPTYYLPPEDVRRELLTPSRSRSFCEWKGSARYWTLDLDGRTVPDAAWSYPDPTPAFAGLRDHLAFFVGRVDACFLGDERVRPQPGGFYGGWVTDDVVGPFKGEPGTEGW